MLLVLSQGWAPKGHQFGLLASSLPDTEARALVPPSADPSRVLNRLATAQCTDGDGVQVPPLARHVTFECFRPPPPTHTSGLLPAASTFPLHASSVASSPQPCERRCVRCPPRITPAPTLYSYRALFNELVQAHQVPLVYQFPLFHRLRLAACVDDARARMRWNMCRLLAIAVLVNFSQEDAALKSFFLFDPEISNELVALLTASPPLPWVRRTSAPDPNPPPFPNETRDRF